MNAPRYPQFRHSQIDQRCGRPEAQKRLVDPHFGQNRTPRFALADLDLGLCVELDMCLRAFGLFVALFLRDFVLLDLLTCLVAWRMLLPLK